MFALKRPAAVLRRLAGATTSSHLPRRTVRLRLTALYGCLFLLSGAGLLGFTTQRVVRQSTGTTFYISRGNGPAQTHIEGVVGGFSAPVAIPPVAILTRQQTVHVVPTGSRSAGSGNRSVRLGARPLGSTRASGPATRASGPATTTVPSRSLPLGPGPPVAFKVLTAPTPQQLRVQARQLTALAGKQSSTERSHLLATSAIALGIMAVISLVLGWLISGRALRPLDEAFEAQRRFVANASHELRTPLAMMRTSLDVAVAKPGPTSPQLRALERKLREGLDQADRLLESFLTLARAQRGGPPQQSSVSLSDLLRVAIDRHAGAAAERDVEIRTDLAGDARVTGNETLLWRMIDNLIDNATRHNEPGGWARVAIESADGGQRGGQGNALNSRPRGGMLSRVRGCVLSKRRGGVLSKRRGAARPGADGSGAAKSAPKSAAKSARIVVENGGPRLRVAEVAELAQPFRRLGAERTGSEDGHGLGLSIVAAIASAHGGAIDLRARAEGGLRVAIELPVSAAPPAREGAPAAGAGLHAGGPS